MQRVILTTGGTGGHVFPALAVAEELKYTYPDVRILFMGAQYGPEKRLATQAGLEFIGLPVRGLLGRGLHAVGAAVDMGKAVLTAWREIGTFRPDIVAGFGSYAAFAPVFAARMRGIPCLLHEQNAICGVSNKVLGYLAQRVCLSLPVAKGFNQDKCVLTGNPVRRSVLALHGMAKQQQPSRRLLIMGGSLGAHALNTYIVSILPQLHEAGVELLHQTGEQDVAIVREAYSQAGYDAGCVHAFIDDMAAAYNWADLVFCRSGATTVAELAAAAKPAVFVPFPHAIHDHQTYNAQCMSKYGAARIVAERDLLQANTAQLLLELLFDTALLQKMGKMAHAQAHIDAAAAVVREMRTLVG